MGAETNSPPTSVNRGSDFVPPAIVEGSAAGLGDHLRSQHYAPGETRARVFEFGSRDLPDPARMTGCFARFDEDGTAKLAISDGVNWHALVAGGTI